MLIVAKEKFNWKKLLFIILGLVLIAAGVILIIQAVHYGILDRNLQIEAHGFYKSDVSMLSYGQHAAQIACWIGGVFGVIFGGGSILAAFDIIGLK